MRPTFRIVIVFCLALTNTCCAQKYLGEFNESEFGLNEERMNFFRDMFETKQQLLDFMQIKKGYAIAEVGAADGLNLGVLSTIYDSVTFYAQDISPKALSEGTWKKTISYYEKKRKTPQTNKFARVIGTISSTNLPDGIFDIVLLIDAYHDFDKKDDIIDDISKKIKPNGKIYILDGFSFPGDTQICPDNGKHILTTLPVEVARFEKHGFYLTQMRGPDKRAHYGQGVVFERDKAKSDEFYKRKNEIDPLVKKSYRFWDNATAADFSEMKEIRDSIALKIKEICEVYVDYEVWIKDVGLRHIRREEHQAAINVFAASTQFFPKSYQAWYWLGEAYNENEQEDLAQSCFKIASKLSPGNKQVAGKLK